LPSGEVANTTLRAQNARMIIRNIFLIGMMLVIPSLYEMSITLSPFLGIVVVVVVVVLEREMLEKKER
jgi:hypothetical protein